MARIPGSNFSSASKSSGSFDTTVSSHSTLLYIHKRTMLYCLSNALHSSIGQIIKSVTSRVRYPVSAIRYPP